MRPWVHRPVRSGVALLVAALVATSCGRYQEPTLTDAGDAPASTGPVGLGEALDLLTENEAIEVVPEARPPALLGLDGPPEPRVPAVLGFERQITPVTGPEPADGASDGGGADVEAGSAGTNETSGGDPDDDAPRREEGVDTTDGDGDGEGDGEGDGDPAEEAPLPAPPPAAAPLPPLYQDPSAMLVGASGRPIELFADAELDRTRRGITARTIRVGGLVTQSLVGNPYRVDVCLGARARFEQSNHHRELSRRIELADCHDDVGQTDLAAGLAATLVRDGAFAVVPMASPAFGAEELLNDERAIYVGDERLPAFCGRANRLGFGTRGAVGCPVLDARGYVSLVVPVLTAYLASRADEAPAVGLTYVVSDGADGASIAASRAFEAELLEMARPAFLALLPTAADPAPTDWREQVDAILATEPDVVLLDGPRTEGLPAALRDEGFRGELVLVGTVDPLVVADPDRRVELAPLTVVSPGLDLANRSTPGWRALAGAAAAVGVEPDEVGLDFVQGYLAADFLVRALAATPEPLSAERLANTVNDGWWYPGVDGVACGSWWPAAHLVPTPCVSIARVEVFSDRLAPVVDLVEVEPQLRFDLDG